MVVWDLSGRLLGGVFGGRHCEFARFWVDPPVGLRFGLGEVRSLSKVILPVERAFISLKDPQIICLPNSRPTHPVDYRV